MGSNNRTIQRIARKEVNVVDRVIEENRTLVPAFTAIVRVDRDYDMVSFTREKARPITPAWEAFNDLTLADAIGLSRKGDCE